MGRWAEVHCHCQNRVALPGSDPLFDKPHRNKRRLREKASKEVEEWERTTKDMFECGHRGGILIELWPWNIMRLGKLIGSIFRDEPGVFEVFPRVGDWRCYENELLLIRPDEVTLWLMEIEEVQRALLGCGSLRPVKVEKLVSEFLRDELRSRLDLERRLDEAARDLPFARVVPFREGAQKIEWPDVSSSVGTITRALMDATALCRASRETGNSVRLLW
jgi:hypothetical protein